jgi:alkyl sulfatase BDS1-like metallo-beta-lactamase superfamily hydrolase
MGGAAAVLARAQADFAKGAPGDYRWVAEVLMHLVWAEPGNTAARALAADAFEQLGYQAESGVWRNAYLSGANELRNGLPKGPAASAGSADVVRALPLDLYFDFMAVRLNPEKAAGKTLVVNWTFTDTGDKVALILGNSVLRHTMGLHADKPDASIELARSTLDDINLQRITFTRAVLTGLAKVEGNAFALSGLTGLLDNFNPAFEIVTPLGSEAARK